MTSKYRISKKTMNALPAKVAEQIEAMGKRYNVKSFTLSTRPAPYELYATEGSHFSVVYGTDSRSVKMASEATLGGGDNMDIGARTKLPAGAWVIEVWYYAGYGMSVTNIGHPALAR